MTIRVGILGASPGNGHPFSFSAIINGYSDSGMSSSGWPGIHNYLRIRDQSEFGSLGMQVTHAWTQDKRITDALCRASHIPNAVEDYEDMIGDVDAVILARDDHEQHLEMATPILKAGLPMLIDKPLTLDLNELHTFQPYLKSGQLMSCSGMRYARELDIPRSTLSDYGEIRLLRGAILNDWAKYGIHLIDAILNVTPARPVAASPLKARHESIAIEMDDGSLFQVDALGAVAPCFRVDIFGTEKNSAHEITDNFSMFRRMLFHFSESLRQKTPAIPAEDTLASLSLAIAGIRAMRDRRRVALDEIKL